MLHRNTRRHPRYRTPHLFAFNPPASSPCRLPRTQLPRPRAAGFSMIRYEQLRDWVIGAPLDPLSQSTRQHIALAAFIAWVGLGADGLSSSAYGPEEAFKALGAHTHLGLYMADRDRGDRVHHLARVQPGHRVVPDRRRRLSRRNQPHRPAGGPRLGRGADRRLCPHHRDIGCQRRATPCSVCCPPRPASSSSGAELLLVAVLLVMNMRGMKESIRFLLPIFVGFFVTHVLLIAYGILGHSQGLTLVVPDAVSETGKLVHDIGWVAALSLFLRAYSLGGGTYTGHRGSLEQRADPARARGTHRQADDVLHGRIARIHRRRHHPVVPALERTAGRGSDAERGCVRLDHRKPGPVRGIQSGVAAARAVLRGGPPVRRRQYRLPRRPVGPVQHGGRLVAAAPVSSLVDAAGDAERHRDHGPRRAGDPALEPRQGRPAGGPVFDQRVPDVFTVAAGTVHLLVARAYNRTRAGCFASRSRRLGLTRDLGHPRGHDHREIRRGRVGDCRHHLAWSSPCVSPCIGTTTGSRRA